MKSVFLLVPLITALSLPLLAAPSADPLRTFTLTIDNHQKQVTVKDGDGSLLFSGPLASPTLTARVKPQTAEHHLITLEDGAGKVLWSRPLAAHGAKWSLNSAQSGQGLLFVSQAIPENSPAIPEKSSTDTEDVFIEAVFRLGADDKVQAFTMQTKKHKASGIPSEDGFSMTIDGKTSVLQLPGTDGAGVLTLSGKNYPFHEVQRSGKTYKDLDWNGKHVLFPKDSHFAINATEGSPDELVIDFPDPSAVPSQNASAAPAK